MANYPTEPKVAAATGSAGLASLLATYIIWQLGVLVFGASSDASKALDAMAAVPYPVSGLLLALLPALGAYVAGWLAPHAARPPEPAKDNAVPVVPGPFN